MRDRIKDLQQAQSAPNADVPSTKRTNLDKLSKSQLIELLSGNIAQPITPEELYRAAASIVAKWCDDVIKATLLYLIGNMTYRTHKRGAGGMEAREQERADVTLKNFFHQFSESVMYINI